MKKHQTPLLKSFNILHSILYIIIFTYLYGFLNNFITNLISDSQILSFLCISIVFLFKTYCYSGIYGALIEIICNEEILLTISNINRNAKKYWLNLLGLYSLLIPVHMVLRILVSDNISFHNIFAYYNVIIILLHTLFLFKKKYIQRYKLPKANFVFSIKEILTFLLLYFILVCTYYLQQNTNEVSPGISRFIALVEQYLYFLQFLYIANLIHQQYPKLSNLTNHEKELYLIYPSPGGITFSLAMKLTKICPPIFVVLKALTSNNYKVREFNKQNWSSRYYKSNVLVAITSYTSNCHEAYKIAKEFKKRGSTVILGGPHVTFLDQEALEYCDSVVIGNVEGLWKNIIEDYENNSLRQVYQGGEPDIEKGLQLVQKELLKSPPLVTKNFIEIIRGCKFKCHFCTVPGINDGKLWTKNIQDIVALIKHAKQKYKEFQFIDNNIYNNPAYAKELFKALIPLKIKWTSNCTIDIGKNDELLKLAKESGCRILIIGYEISGESDQKNTGGKFSMAKQYREYTKNIKKHGISVKGNFILGFDSDSFKSLIRLWFFAISLRPLISVLYLLSPMPGSKLYTQTLKDNRIVSLNWRHYNGTNLLVKHKKLSHLVLSQIQWIICPLFTITTSTFGLICIILITSLFSFYFLIPH